MDRLGTCEIPPRPRGRQPEPGLRRTKRPRLGRLLHPPGSASANTNPEDRAEPGREPEADGMRGGKSWRLHRTGDGGEPSSSGPVRGKGGARSREPLPRHTGGDPEPCEPVHEPTTDSQSGEVKTGGGAQLAPPRIRVIAATENAKGAVRLKRLWQR